MAVAVRARPVIPSGGISRRRRGRLIAIVAARNEARNVPGLLANLTPHVDGIVALDDGSVDGTSDLLRSSDAVLALLRRCRDGSEWDEVGNHRRLVSEALRHAPDWLLSVDADERLERDFRSRTERVIHRGSVLGIDAFGVRIRELWDSPSRFRVDGIWGRKSAARLFRAAPENRFDERPLHAHKAPLQSMWLGRGYPLADLWIYHLRMVHASDRAARRERYERADPAASWQPGIGYAYLTSTSGLSLRAMPARRAYME